MVCLTPMGSHDIPSHPVNRPRLRAAACEPCSSGPRGLRRRGASWTASSRISPTGSTPRAGSRSRPRSGRRWRRTASRASTPIRRWTRRRSTAAATSYWRKSTRCSPRCRRSRRRATPSRPRCSGRARSCAWIRRGGSSSTTGLKASLGLGAGGGVRRAGAQVPDLGAVALRRASRSGAGAGPAHAGGAGRRGAGMTETARHVPVLLAEVLKALAPRAGRCGRRRHFRRGRL